MRVGLLQYVYCLFYGFFSANQGFLKTFQIVLIGWIKAGPPKSHFCFDHVNWLITDCNAALFLAINIFTCSYVILFTFSAFKCEIFGLRLPPTKQTRLVEVSDDPCLSCRCNHCMRPE